MYGLRKFIALICLNFLVLTAGLARLYAYERNNDSLEFLESFPATKLKIYENTIDVIDNESDFIRWCKGHLWMGEELGANLLIENEVDFDHQVVIWLTARFSEERGDLSLEVRSNRNGILKIDVRKYTYGGDFDSQDRSGTYRRNPSYLYVTNKTFTNLRTLRRIEFYNLRDREPFYAWPERDFNIEDILLDDIQTIPENQIDKVELLYSRSLYYTKRDISRTGVIRNEEDFLRFWGSVSWDDDEYGKELLRDINFDSQVVLWVMGASSPRVYDLELKDVRFNGGKLRTTFDRSEYVPSEREAMFARYLGRSPLKIYVTSPDFFDLKNKMAYDGLLSVEFYEQGADRPFSVWGRP